MDNASDEIIVKFDHVTKQYGDLIVLNKLNLDIKKNEMVSIIGPSGSGKTTVLLDRSSELAKPFTGIVATIT